MDKNKKRTIIVIAVLCVMILCLALYKLLRPADFKVSADEIAIRIKLNVKEDIGLIVYDYEIDGHEFGGGVGNADRSLIRHDEEIITTWTKEELKLYLDREIDTDSLPFKMSLRIITEYVDPNYENAYPEEITRYLDTIEWDACFGEEKVILITGDKENGYTAVLEYDN